MGWLAIVLCFGFSGRAAERWKMQLFYDKDDSSLAIKDLQCPSALRCIAAGSILGKNHAKGTVIVTNDGGEHWSYIPVEEHPVSLVFLNDTLGWMVTDGGIWLTNEGGRSWKKLKSLK